MKDYDINEILPSGKIKPIKINSSLKDIHRFLDQLILEQKKSSPSFDKLRHTCLELIHRLPLPVNTYNSFVLRSRPNFLGQIFETATQISYNPKFDESKAGRFNLAGESVFYGAVPLNNEESNGALTTTLESLKEIFDEKHEIKEQYYTIGKWELIKPFYLFILTFFDEAINNCSEVRRINEIYRNHLKAICNEKDRLKCNRFYGYISKFASKKCENENEYLVTTAFFHALKQYYGDEVGLLYSSSMTENKGLNIVLPTNVIDNGYLRLADVVMYKAVRNPNNPKQFNFAPYKIGHSDSNGIITFGEKINDETFLYTFKE